MSPSEMKAAVARAIEGNQDDIIGVAQHICSNPEVGYTEVKTANFVKEKLEGLGIDVETGLAITGMKGHVTGGGGPGPSVAVIGELDSLRVFDHPLADPETGAAHACGHHCQVGSMYGALTGLIRSGVLEHLWGRVVAMVVPAEEFIDVQERLELRNSGAIEFLGGKQEFMKLGLLDDVDMAMLVHTAPEGVMPNQAALAVGGTSNGHVAKLVEYTGFGAHAGAAPHMGVNALNAAMIGLSAIHANRETFQEKDMVRVHGILTRGGEAVSAIPPQVVLEWRVRAGSPDAVVRYADKVDRAFKAGAMAVGAKVDITNIPGYLPMRNDPMLQELFVDNAHSVVGEDKVLIWSDGYNRGGSTDMGDVSHVIPALHPYCGGVTGTPHANDYIVQDYHQAVINPAIVMAMTIVDLLSDEARVATKVVENNDAPMTRDEYLEYQRERARVISFDGAAE